MRRALLTAGMFAAVFTRLLTGQASAQDARLAEAGKQLYEARECDRCHMVGGHGYTDGKLDGVASRLSADEMRRWLTKPIDMEAKLDKKPKVRMSSRKQMVFTEAELTAIVTYLRTLR